MEVGVLDAAYYEQMFHAEQRHWWFRSRRAVIRALLTKSERPQRCTFLDAGCGTGFNLRAFADLGDGVGVEPSTAATRFAHERGIENVVEGDARALPFADASFDLVMALDVLEHIDDPDTALAEMRRVARAGATLVATVPAYDWLWSQHDETHHHHRRYTRPGLLGAAGLHGWQPVFATYFNTLLLPPIAVTRLFRRNPAAGRSDYELTGGRLNGLLTIPMLIEARAIHAGVRFPAGVSIGGVFVAT